MTDSLDIVGIGNAIVDVLAPVADGFLDAWSLEPGSMSLIDAGRADLLTAALAEASGGRQVLRGGGSAANTCVAASSLGARVGFLGKVADDELGRAFGRDLEASGIRFPSKPVRDGVGEPAATGRCLVVVTGDGQRTMSTFLGAANALAADDIDEALIAAAAFTYLEGYLFDPPSAQAAFRLAAGIAHRAGRRVAISLSDAFCVERHRDAFRAFIRDHADIVFANEVELCALYETGFEAALGSLEAETGFAAVTRGEAGSVISTGGVRHAIAAVPTEVIDTTGAGDAFAAGVLAGLVRGFAPDRAGALGSLAAAEVISHLGARPETALAGFAAERGF